MGFPKDFVWGAAAASYQIEGGWNDDGKGLSVWDVFSHTEGKVWQGHTGDVACDHYHRYEDDVKLMQEIGLKAYRLSISWPRVLPEGVGTVNDKGLDFYSRLVDRLLEAGIRPWVTLFHWDYPYALYNRGGWLNPESPDWFAEYTEVIVNKLSDRVTHWMTQNEIQCFIGLGHQTGTHAPGLKLPFREVLQAGHHALIAHGRSVQAIRAHAKQAPKIGLAPVGNLRAPASERTADVQAAREATFAVTERDCWNTSWWMDPVVFGRYPEDGLELYGEDAPEVKPGDMETIRQPLDFFGVNIYQAARVRADEMGLPEQAPFPPGYPHTAMPWPVTPEALYWGPRFFHERYKLPVAITENGLSNRDWIHLDGKVHDPQRIDFLHQYIKAFRRAAEEGIPTLGYFQWSIMDNFEWAEGYKERFGLIYVDYATGRRVLKDSAHWYRDVIRTNGDEL